VDYTPGQSQLFEVEPTSQRWSAENLPRYEDVVLTPEQVEEAERLWPSYTVYRKGPDGKRVKTPGGRFVVEKVVETTEAQRLAYMRKRVHNRMLNEIVVDPISGRRALGGPQRGTAGKEKKRLDQMMVEEAENRSREITDALFSALEKGVDPAVRHKAAVNIMREARAVHEQAQKDDELERASGEDLARLAAETVLSMVSQGKISSELLSSLIPSLGPIVDAEAVELP
jgi:hypothetical protein